MALPDLESVLAQVERTVARHGLLAPGQRVLVACSGGPDSTALLALLQRCVAAPRLVVAHVDHGLRSDSADDARAVAALAASLDLPYVERTLALGEAGPVSEDTARRARLAALEELAADSDASLVALGHTADDQLETLVMRLVRGAGLTGLAGMAPRRDPFVRPLLEVGRREVEGVLQQLGWTPSEDPTNRSETYLRNRIRRHVVPLLKAENPRLLEAVTRTTQGLREALDAMRSAEAAAFAPLQATASVGAAVDVAGLAALPAGLSTRIVRRLWREAREAVRAGQADAPRAAELGRAQVEQVLGLLEADTGPRLDLPGRVVAFRQYDRLVVAPAASLADPGDVELRVNRAGEHPVPALGVALHVHREAAEDPAPLGPLVVRNLRPGDRLADRVGHRKLSDFLVDRKVPRAQRRHLPLVLWQGEIVWIPGVWYSLGVDVDPSTGRARLRDSGVVLEFRAHGWD